MLRELQTVDYSKFAIPMQELIDLNLTTFKAVTEAQHKVINTLFQQGQESTQAAMGIKDLESLFLFMKEQGEVTQSNLQVFAERNQLVVKDVQTYATKLQAILSNRPDQVEEVNEVQKPIAAKKPSVKK